jgi:acid phosphatase (class A)
MAELAELFELQRSRTTEMTSHAQKDYERTLSRFLDDPRINLPTEKIRECATCSAFFARLKDSIEAVNEVAKNKFHRVRPYKLPNNGLVPLKEIKPDDSPSYPSGHAAFAALTGIMLAQMVPERRTEIFERVKDYCNSRLVSGVHFRSDVDAGQVLGSVIAAWLFRNEGFKRDFETTKTELRKALGM